MSMEYIDTVNARDKLLALLPEVSTPEGLILACSLIAAQEYIDVSPEKIFNQLNHLATEALEYIDLSVDMEEVVKELCFFIGNVKGFSGNTINYYNPQNSYLNRVLLNREGIPITLAVIYMYIAHRLGLKAEGVGFPGHFLVRVVARIHLPGIPAEKSSDHLDINNQQGILIDPFNHVILSLDECRKRLQVLYGKNYTLENDYLKSASYGEIILRILRNLKSIFINKGEYSRVISLCEQILFIEQNALAELLERSYALEKMQCYGAAVKDLELYIDLADKYEHQSGKSVSEIDLFKVKQNLKLLRKKINTVLH